MPRNGFARAREAILDGEIIALDEAGVPRFDWLMHRRHPASFCAFDLVGLNGRDQRDQPLLERKAALRKIIPKHSPWVLYADHVIEHGVELLRRFVSVTWKGSSLRGRTSRMPTLCGG